MTVPYSSKRDSIRLVVWVNLGLALAALLLSGMLVCKHSGICSAPLGCEINGVDGCAELGNSAYSKIQIPFTDQKIPIAWFGFFYYALLALLFLRLQRIEKKGGELSLDLLAGLVVFGFVFDLLLAYRNFFTLLTPCLLCAYTYLCQVGILLSTFWLYFSPRRGRQEKGDVGTMTALWEGIKASRMALGGASAATLVLFIVLALSGGESTGAPDQPSQRNAVLSPSAVERVLREFRALKKVELSAKGLSSFEGANGAYIFIHEWLDFRCPHCRDGSEALHEAMRRWPGRIKAYYRYFPLDGSCNPAIERSQPDAASCKAAQAALCVSKKEFFSSFFHQLFAFQTSRTHISYTSLRTLVGELGGAWPRVQSCMRSAATRAALNRDLKDAAKIKIKATPTFVLNGRLLPSGIPDRSWFLRVLDALVIEKEGEAAIKDYESRNSANSQ